MANEVVIITGGAGFIGCNTARRFLERGFRVIVVDNLSRVGSEENLRWLQELGPVEHLQTDIRDREGLLRAIRRQERLDLVIHLAAQVAVTTSVANPREDFDINLMGTFNLLEALREAGTRPLLVYASTNKVYGKLEHDAVAERDGRYAFADLRHGVSESHQLDFHSPYGCSKGGADQYVRDYARIYGIDTVVVRQSCIYGPRQFGVEDQGWLAWFTIAAEMNWPITVYGDGKQVRDVLYVDDLVDLYERLYERGAAAAGQVYNVGGGPEHVLSLLELIRLLEDLAGRKLQISFSDWRPGDQPVFVSDIRSVRQDLGWMPTVGAASGVRRLHAWVRENREMLRKFHK